MKKVGYKAAQIRKDDAGKFKNNGQKEGSKALKGKEKAGDLSVDGKLRKISTDLFKLRHHKPVTGQN